MKKIDIKSNVLKQNCFLLDQRDSVDIASDKVKKYSYISVDEKIREDGTGIEIVCSEHDYDITPESVNSYLAGADYKQNLTSQMANSPVFNLGDSVALMQELSRLDSADLADLKKKYSSVLGAISKLSKDPQLSQLQPQTISGDTSNETKETK